MAQSPPTDVQSTRPSLREAQRQLTLQQIMVGARACFLRKSYPEVAVEEIAAAAAVSRATFYNHFPDKKSLIAAMIEHFLEPMWQNYRWLTENPPQTRNGVGIWIDLHFQWHQTFRDDIRIVHQAATLDPAIAQHVFSLFAASVEQIMPIAMAGRPASQREAVRAQIWIASRALDSLCMEIVSDGRALDRPAIAGQLTTLWCSALNVPTKGRDAAPATRATRTGASAMPQR